MAVDGEATSDAREPRFAVAAGVVWRELGDRVWVVSPVDLEHRQLRGSAVDLWPALVRGATRSELLQLADADASDPSRAVAVDEFVAELESSGIVDHGA
jgi:hypothetical protein